MWSATLESGMWGFWLCCDPGHIPSPLWPLSLGRKQNVNLKKRWPLSPLTFRIIPVPRIPILPSAERSQEESDLLLCCVASGKDRMSLYMAV